MLARLSRSLRFQQLLGVALLAAVALLSGIRIDGSGYWAGSEQRAWLQRKLEQKLEKRRKNPKPYQYPSEAQEYFFQKRAARGQSALPRERYTRALEKMRGMPRHSLRTNQTLTPQAAAARRFSSLTTPQAGGGSDSPIMSLGILPTWTFLGPDNIAGRTRALLIDPGTPETMYAAGVAGGVWKTTDSGSTWSPTSDLIANLAVNSMAMDPSDSTIIYAGTGEGFFNLDQVRGDGIFKTTDGGANWTQLAATANNSNFHYVNDIIVSPNNSSRVYAATRRGVLRTTDGGTTWSDVILQPESKVNMGFVVRGGCLDLALRDGGTTDILFAACGTFEQASVYRSLDASVTTPTFTEELTETNMGRTSLAIAPSNPEIIYALSASLDDTGDFEDGLHKVFRATDSDEASPMKTWTTQVDNTDPTPLNTFLLTNSLFANASATGACPGGSQFFNQGWYDNVIAVDPVDPDRVWVGGIDLFRSDNQGQDWGLASYWWAASPGQVSDPPGYAHADHHVIVFHPDFDGNTNKIMYTGNDGGLFRTNDARVSVAMGANAPCSSGNTSVAWTEINNNYGTAQFYHGVPYPGGTTFFGGTQDNGTLRGNDSSTDWEQGILGGDGGYVAVEPTLTTTLYAELPQGDIRKSTNGGTSFSSATSGISDSGFLFIAPVVLDPDGTRNASTRRLWTGGRFIWRTDDAAGSWTQASVEINDDSDFSPNSNGISAIAVAPGDPDTVLAGTRHGIIYRDPAATPATTTDNTTVWDQSQPRDGHVSWLAFDPSDGTHMTVYATVSSFDFGMPDNGHVFKSTDGGASWSDITNDLPDIPVHSIVVDPSDSNRLYIATDLGVFLTSNGGTNWAVENTGFANVITEALAIESVSGTPNLFAFTHGRGVWRVELTNPVPVLTSFLSPSSVPEDAASFSLTVFGTGFVGDSVVRWDGADRTTSFISSTQLIATIPTNDVASPGSALITVFSPTPGGGTSNSLTFNFSPSSNLQPPEASSIVPSTTVAGGPALTVSVVGSGFTEDSFVRWNGIELPTRFVNARQLVATIPARALARSGAARVSVFDPHTGASNSLTFTVLSRRTLQRGRRPDRRGNQRPWR